MYSSAPKYKDLPVQPGAPPGSAWGVFDQNGQRDVYGTLNFATRDAVVAAKEEILTGESVVLKYVPITYPFNIPVNSITIRFICLLTALSNLVFHYIFLFSRLQGVQCCNIDSCRMRINIIAAMTKSL